ncbi:DMT family transporter [Mycolicibacterium sp. S2-37]|uniref:DMT family transporter n=1 Tax=Mycolicibacterium sp. S2-37 TaxID=2810297 RepID=UPI0027D9E203|nr:DMT family transporter [Mycolicibacterium sp. S2-37]
MPKLRSLPVWLQFALLAATWGSSFLFVEVGLEGLTPVQVVWARMAGGAVALTCVALVARVPIPGRDVVWLHIGVVAVLLCVVPFLLFAWAQQYIASSLTSIYNATTPLMTMLVAMAALREERLTARRISGVSVGLAGVLVVLAPWEGLPGGPLVAQLACLSATASYGVAFVYLRRFVAPRRLPAVTVATLQVGIGAAIMIILGLATARRGADHGVDLSASVVVSMVALGVLGTGMAYVWNTNVVAAWGATAGATVTYLTPVVGVTLGVTLLGERLSWNQPVGAAIVLVGITMTTGTELRPRTPMRSSEPT